MAETSPYEGMYIVTEDLPDSRKTGRYENKDKNEGDKTWKADVEAWKKLAKDTAPLPKDKRITITEVLGSYERSAELGYYKAPVNGYLCGLLLGKDGKIVKDLSRDGYLGLEYAAMISTATREFMDICGRRCGYSMGGDKIELLRDALVDSSIWDKIGCNIYAEDFIRIEKLDYPETILKGSDINTAMKLVHDDIRKRTEEKLKALAKKNGVGSTTP